MAPREWARSQTAFSRRNQVLTDRGAGHKADLGWPGMKEAGKAGLNAIPQPKNRSSQWRILSIIFSMSGQLRKRISLQAEDLFEGAIAEVPDQPPLS
jgi:hypothetical protein